MEQTAKLNVFGRIKRVPATRRERWAWYFFDFGNSSYAAVVLLAVYSAYFKQTVVGGPMGSRLWGFSVGIAMLVTAILSPILGAMADSSATKKRLLSFFTITSVTFTALLFFVEKGEIWMGMLFFILAEIGYRGGQVFYNSLLPDIAEREEIGRVSGNGWAFGSLGGIVCLVLVLGLILAFKGTFVIRVAFLITAVFYGLSVLPLFLFVRERTAPQPLPAKENYISFSMKKLAQTWKQAAQFKQFMLFVVAFLIFNNAIMMTMDFAGIIGVTLFNLNQQQLIIFIIIVQITSVIGAFVFGKLVDKLTSKRALIFAILGMMLACSSLFWVNSVLAFYLVGALAGFMLTGVQSVSRTTVGQLAPEEKSTEFFGIFSLAGQVSNFTGPALYGLIATAIALSRERKGWDPLLAEQSGLRVAVIAMVAFLAVGLVALLFVRNWQRGGRAAEPVAAEKTL